MSTKNQRVAKKCEGATKVKSETMMSILRSNRESNWVRSSPRWWERYTEVVYERGHIEFLERVFSATGVWKLAIVSPWIASLENDPITVEDIADYIARYHIKTLVIMRSPQKEPTNAEAAELFKRRIGSTLTLYYNNSVHAKIYVCRCQPFGFALLGSANLTPHKSRSYEVGLIINGFGAGEKIIEELELTATDYIPGKGESSLEWAPWYRR